MDKYNASLIKIQKTVKGFITRKALVTSLKPSSKLIFGPKTWKRTPEFITEPYQITKDYFEDHLNQAPSPLSSYSSSKETPISPNFLLPNPLANPPKIETFSFSSVFKPIVTVQIVFSTSLKQKNLLGPEELSEPKVETKKYVIKIDPLPECKIFAIRQKILTDTLSLRFISLSKLQVEGFKPVCSLCVVEKDFESSESSESEVIGRILVGNEDVNEKNDEDVGSRIDYVENLAEYLQKRNSECSSVEDTEKFIKKLERDYHLMIESGSSDSDVSEKDGIKEYKVRIREQPANHKRMKEEIDGKQQKKQVDFMMQVSSDKKHVNYEVKNVELEAKSRTSDTKERNLEQKHRNSEPKLVNSESKHMKPEPKLVNLEQKFVNSEPKHVKSELKHVKPEQKHVKSEQKQFSFSKQVEEAGIIPVEVLFSKRNSNKPQEKPQETARIKPTHSKKSKFFPYEKKNQVLPKIYSQKIGFSNYKNYGFISDLNSRKLTSKENPNRINSCQSEHKLYQNGKSLPKLSPYRSKMIDQQYFEYFCSDHDARKINNKHSGAKTAEKIAQLYKK